MTTTITAQDGTGDSTTPASVDGFERVARSGNVVHELIAPGEIAVTLLGDLPPTGTLPLVYATDAAAEAARLLLGRATSFALVSDTRPIVNLTFVRQGHLTAALHDQVRGVWVLSVGYQEIVP
ncbi:hypothetical protein [Microbacterium schleiferi]|uniref:Uncharacterized protein n=1 Tax=Microbacterium schleiferi TaxID=69362 RepID=A0ABU7V7H1_9MICO